MIRKLRKDRNLSQEQLSIIAGVSLRTVQRIESGHGASLETLKSLASVFEVSVDFLRGEISLIDKKSEDWANAPYWVKLGFWGIRERKVALRFEYLSIFLGICMLLLEIYIEAWSGPSFAFFLSAYCYAVCIRWVDNRNLWI
jgi:transcriptional regulator with XRE-family HTH domain